ncbi:MAG: HTH-type transcriptional regulator MalT [Psychromonas sp.]
MIIKSKLSVPPLLKNGIIRKRLFDDFIDAKLGLVCAPAGYGKSTAIAEWSQHQEHLSWFSIDKSDNSPSQFCNYFIHAINQIEGVSCPASLAMAKQNNKLDLVNLVTLLLNELSEFNKPLCFVLDDFHHIKDKSILQGLPFFIKHMPLDWRLIISSRTMPPLSVSYLRIKQQLFEINEESLAFTAAETDEFFAKNTTFLRDPQEQEALRLNVEGWPTALQLVLMLSKDSVSFTQCAQEIGKSNHVYLWDYLEEEVFLSLTPKLQEILLKIAPLNRVDASIVNELCDISDGQLQLDLLKEHGAFIVPIDSQQESFTFHSFFKSFLLHKCKSISGFESDDKKIAQIWLAREEVAEALPHVLKIQDEKLVLTFLQEAGWKLFHDGHLNSLAQCFELIKQSIWVHPELILLNVSMLQSRHQGYKIAPMIKRAEKVFLEKDIHLSEIVKSEFDVIKAQIAINQGKINEALKLAENALITLSKDNMRANIVAQAVIAEAHHCLGSLPIAYQYFQEVKQLASAKDMHQTFIWATYQQAEILNAQGNHQEADKYIEQAITLILQHNLQKLPLYTFPLHFKAQRAYQDGHYDEAERYCEQALNIVSPYGESWVLYTYTLQAKIALEKGNSTYAGHLIDEIERLLRNQNYHSDWIAATNYVRIKYWRINNDLAAIERWLITAPQPDTAFNHFDQCHRRNRVRALIQLNKLEEAQALLEDNINHAQQCKLQTEVNRNLILLSSVESRMKQYTPAKKHLSQAVESSLFTGLNTSFVRESLHLGPIYQELVKETSLVKSVKDKLIKLASLSDINLHEAHINPFDSASVLKIQTHADTPRLIKNIPLTSREWQVLGFIYSGYRNHQIADSMGVAPTTVKSHIRNVYQKLGLEDRNEALLLTKELVSLIN